MKKGTQKSTAVQIMLNGSLEDYLMFIQNTGK